MKNNDNSNKRLIITITIMIIIIIIINNNKILTEIMISWIVIILIKKTNNNNSSNNNNNKNNNIIINYVDSTLTLQAEPTEGVFTLQHTPANHARRCAQVHFSHRGCSGGRTARWCATSTNIQHMSHVR